jgi:hypothetical protein
VLPGREIWRDRPGTDENAGDRAGQEERLDGRRRLTAGQPVVEVWWTVPAFRAYAAYTAEFRAALDGVLGRCGSRTVAVVCSESVWRCHRRLIADAAMLTRACPVRHLMPDGRLSEHRVAAGRGCAPTGCWYGTVVDACCGGAPRLGTNADRVRRSRNGAR